jgi:hypothetical protein
MSEYKYTLSYNLECPVCGCEAHYYKRQDNKIHRIECMSPECCTAIETKRSKGMVYRMWEEI